MLDFIFHHEFKEMLSEAPRQVRLEVYEAIVDYGTSGTLPNLKAMGKVAFHLAKTMIDKDTERQRQISEKRAAAGRKHRGNQYTNQSRPVCKMEQMEQNGTNGTSVPTVSIGVVVDDGKYADSQCVAESKGNGTNGTNVPNTQNQPSQKKEKASFPPIPPILEKEKKTPTTRTHAGELERRRMEFYDSLVPFIPTYGKLMIREFYDYWSECNKSHTQMRFEKQPTWETPRRLATWAKRENIATYNHGNNRTSNSEEFIRQSQQAGIRETQELIEKARRARQ